MESLEWVGLVLLGTGKVWACDPGVHALAMPWTDPTEPDEWAIASADATLQRMAHGLIDCDDPACEVCCM